MTIKEETSIPTQWERVPMLDIDVGLSVEEAERRGEELQRSLGSLVQTGVLEGKEVSFTDASGASHSMSHEGWADFLINSAAARRGISYAGEPPTRPVIRQNSPFETLP